MLDEIEPVSQMTWQQALREQRLALIEFYCQHEARLTAEYQQIRRGMKSVYPDTPESALCRPTMYALLEQVYRLIYDQPLELVN